MNKIKFLLLLVVCLQGSGGLYADDIEMLVRDTTPPGTAFFHVVLDSSSTAFNTLCTYGLGGSCAPPFMSAEVYRNLRPGHHPGDSISRFETFTAILAALFKQPEYQSMHISLLISDKNQGARVLSVYKQLGGEYSGISGTQSLIAAMAAVPLRETANQQHNFQAKDAFYIWYSYINDAAPTVSDFGHCSRFYSVVMATESSEEDYLLDSNFSRKLAMPAQSGLGFSDVLLKMRANSTDLLPRALDGINPLEKAWVVAPLPSTRLSGEWARAGGGGAPLNIDDPARLEKSLGMAFQQAISSSRTRVAVWAPVSSLGISKSTEGVFIGLVEPQATIRWRGNLKKYKVGSDSTPGSGSSTRVVDKKAVPAIVSSGKDKGRIALAAHSFWTDSRYLPSSDGTPVGADGRVVARGGAGQKIPGFLDIGGQVIGDGNTENSSRQVFTEPQIILNGSDNRLVPFNADEVSTVGGLTARLGASSSLEAEALIRWGRGQDVDDEDSDGNVKEARPWIMGSVLHSKAVALNYGAVAGYSPENPNIRVFLGTGDGIFHAYENTDSAGFESGREVFAFYPYESLGNIKLRRENTISSLKMRYGVDGGITVFSVDNNQDGNLNFQGPDFDEAYVYFGMRRGGYSYYALDVSNPSGEPAIKWKISPVSSAHGAGDFGELGQTFSKPVVGKVKYEDKVLDVLVFAGGYNGGWDARYENRVGKDLGNAPDVTPEGGTGNAIFIVNARTGELVWKAVYGATTDNGSTSANTRFRHAEMVDSIPSTVSPIKSPSGIIERLYVGDTSGALWRIDLPASHGPINPNHRKEHWFASKLADLGGAGAIADRRFFHGPDIVQTRESRGSSFDGILISSGDRAHPNDITATNYHFYIKDFLISAGDDAARQRPAIMVGDDAAASDLSDRTNCPVGGASGAVLSCDRSMAKGWMIELARPGEKGLSSPLVDGGRVFFTSYVPPELGACSISAGEAYVYIVNLEDGSAVHSGVRIYPLGSGIASAVMTLADSLLVPLGGTGDFDQTACTGSLCQRHSPRLYKTYWRELGIDEF